MQEAGKGDKQRPTNHAAYADNYDAIFCKKKVHQIRSAGIDTHKGEYWYKCQKCGKSDWIASYGTMTQLDFYNTPCN